MSEAKLKERNPFLGGDMNRRVLGQPLWQSRGAGRFIFTMGNPFVR
jgi:hypothetical protein